MTGPRVRVSSRTDPRQVVRVRVPGSCAPVGVSPRAAVLPRARGHASSVVGVLASHGLSPAALAGPFLLAALSAFEEERGVLPRWDVAADVVAWRFEPADAPLLDRVFHDLHGGCPCFPPPV